MDTMKDTMKFAASYTHIIKLLLKAETESTKDIEDTEEFRKILRSYENPIPDWEKKGIRPEMEFVFGLFEDFLDVYSGSLQQKEKFVFDDRYRKKFNQVGWKKFHIDTPTLLPYGNTDNLMKMLNGTCAPGEYLQEISGIIQSGCYPIEEVEEKIDKKIQDFFLEEIAYIQICSAISKKKIHL